MPKLAAYQTWIHPRNGEAPFLLGYNAIERNGKISVRFYTPNGTRVERMTKCVNENDPKFHPQAAVIILREYAALYEIPQEPKQTKSWEEAVKVLTTDLRPDTLIAYEKAIRIMRETLKAEKVNPAGPAELTKEHASLFAVKWLAGTYKRSNASDAKEYKRKPATLAFYLRQLSACWALFHPLGYVSENVWKSVRKPKLDKTMKHVPTEDETEHFFIWVKERYPKWERLHTFLELKALSACRTKDICQLRTNQLKQGRVVWEADQTKQRAGRSLPLPADLYDSLKKTAATVYLFGGFIEDMKKFRDNKSKLGSKVFTPETLAAVIGNIFREYSDVHPERPRFSPHALRRRGITLAVAGSQSVDAAANAIGVTTRTAKANYLNKERAFNSDAFYERFGDAMRMPKSIPNPSPKNQNGTEHKGTTDNKANGE